MASIAKDPNGCKRLLFVDSDGRRRTIRLGKLPMKAAETIKHHVEVLLSCRASGTPWPVPTAQWVNELSNDLANKLARVGLIPPRHRLTVADYLDSWLAEKKTLGYKPATLAVTQTMLEELRKLFATRLLSDITIEDAQSYRSAMQSRGLRPATIARRLGRARQVFSDAVRQGLIAANPFERIRVRSGNPAERRVYVSVADTLRVIEHCPNVWWRLLVALASAPSQDTFGINGLQFAAGIFRGHLPVDAALPSVEGYRPRRNFLLKKT